MDKVKKDFLIFYLARNAIATFFITLIAFVCDFMIYFDMTISRAIMKVFVDNIYTTLYFLLLWILNYLLFEIYKIMVDGIKHNGKIEIRFKIGDKKIISYDVIVLVVIFVLLLFIEFERLFRFNFILLILFMILRGIKEEIKYYKK